MLHKYYSFIVDMLIMAVESKRHLTAAHFCEMNQGAPSGLSYVPQKENYGTLV